MEKWRKAFCYKERELFDTMAVSYRRRKEIAMFRALVTLGLWLAGLAFAILNGLVGAMLWEPLFGSYGNHVAKTIIAILFFFFVLGKWHARLTSGPRAMQAAWYTAIIWLVLTAAVEIPLSLWVRGLDWSETIRVATEAYYIWEGQLWILVLLALVTGPVYWAGKLNSPHQK
jgi:hypothetical protein